MNPKLVPLSRFLSLVLRHQPDRIGLRLDAQGWASIDELLESCAQNGKHLTRPLLAEIVATNDKQRFRFSEDGLRIRANQGHSIDIDLGLTAMAPPDVLYHGTAHRFLASILREGLQKMQRHHVHLSADPETARKVGARHGQPVVITIDAKQMHEEGFNFFRSENGVWLTEHVGPDYFLMT